VGGPIVVTPSWFPRRAQPLVRPWREVEYIVVDLETTGLDLKRDAIVSYGAVVIRDGRIVVAENTYGLVRAGREMTPASTAVHTLRRVDIADAPPLSHAVAVLDTLLQNRILVAHAAWIEKAFLNRAFADHGATLRSPIIDTAALARADGIAPRGSRREPDLEWLAGEIGLPAVNPHHALGDAITTAHVFLALASRLGRLGYRKASDFVDLTVGDRVLKRR
jgi:DNA polymerase III subunit epsilon